METGSSNELPQRSYRVFSEVLKVACPVHFDDLCVLGSKHWSTKASSRVWDWVTPRLPRILAAATPDTVQIWESLFSLQLQSRDPRRNQPLVDFILSLPLEFTGASPFLSK